MKVLNKTLRALDNRTCVVTLADVVAAAIIDYDARLVRQNQCPDVVQHVRSNGAGDRAVEYRQWRHLIREVGPEAENAAAGKHDAAVLRRSRLRPGCGRDAR